LIYGRKSILVHLFGFSSKIELSRKWTFPVPIVAFSSLGEQKQAIASGRLGLIFRPSWPTWAIKFLFTFCVSRKSAAFVGWLAGWLVGWLAGWSVGWLAGWLAGGRESE